MLMWQKGDIIQKRWQVTEVFGGPEKSGMGVVYRVYDQEGHVVLAAKTFQGDAFGYDSPIVDRFVQEARIWVGMDIHQNVTRAHFVQEFDGRPFLFMEYVSGGDLTRQIRGLARDPIQVLRFAIQFCDGMSHAQSKGLKAHRDIKPSNCLITNDGTLKITDFGLAKAFDDIDRNLAYMRSPTGQQLGVGLSRTGTGAGTPTHMAPEQFDDLKHVDIRADIYAFGVMLYQMLTTELPFRAGSWQEYEILHKTQKPPSLPNTPHIPAQCRSELDQILWMCLGKNPVDRFQNFGQVRTCLAKVYQRQTGDRAPEVVAGEELRLLEQNDKCASLASLGRHEEAISCLDEILALDPRFELAWFNKGMSLMQLGQHVDALACLERAIQIKPHYELAWFSKATVLGTVERLDESLECFDRVLQINPCSELAWANRGVTLGTLGRPHEALACLDRAVEINPDDAKIWYTRGVILGQLRGHEEAIKCYTKALRINPHWDLAWNNKGAELGILGRYEEAIECLDYALALNPRSGHAWFNKGGILGNQDRHREALACFFEAQQLRHPQAGQAIQQCQSLLRTGM